MASKTERGRKAEDIAARYLKKRGIRVIARNYYTKKGEIDIIAREGDTLCVVEVRSRGKDSPRRPEADLGPEKVERLRFSAGQLVRKYRLNHVPIRLDLLVVDWEEGDPEIRYYPGGITEMEAG